jgi:hypothetical protein
MQTVQRNYPVSIAPLGAAFWMRFAEGAGNSLRDDVQGLNATGSGLVWVNDPAMGKAVDFGGAGVLGIPVNLPGSPPIFKGPPDSYSIIWWFRPKDLVAVFGLTLGRILDTNTIAAFVNYPNLNTGGTFTVAPRDANNDVHLGAVAFQHSPIPAILAIAVAQVSGYQVYANLTPPTGTPAASLLPQFSTPLPCKPSNMWINNVMPANLWIAGTSPSGHVPNAIIGGLGIVDHAMSQAERDAFFSNPFGKA